MNERRMVVVGGVSFIVGALSFVAVFSYLAAKFNYPDVLDGSAAEVLPHLRAGGTTMRAVWAVYAFLPLLLVPAAVGAACACPASRARMRLAQIAVALGALAMCLGLMRWPSIHWALAEAYPQAAGETTALDAIFRGLNLYLGNYIGEFLGETLLAAFFLLLGLSMLAEARFPRWVGWAGIAFSVSFLLGALRNVTSSLQAIADVNNTLLPLWMIVVGVAMLRCSVRSSPSAPSHAAS